MRVLVYPADKWGCGHYRMIWPGLALKAQGYDVDVIIPGEGSGIGGKVLNGRVVELDIQRDADVFIMQRPTNIMAVDLIRLLREAGKTVVVDMDDDLTRIHPANIAFRMLHPKWSPQNNWRLAIDGCKFATLVTVSTPPLLERYGKMNNTRVLRNCIPARFLEVEHRTDVEPVWGWGGALHSHPDDLPILGTAVHAMNQLGFEFKIIGHAAGTGRALGLSRDPDGPGSVEFDDWIPSLAQLAVGAAPLADTAFNRSKSWLKPLEYAAAGVPFVASNTIEYIELQAQGAGLVVNNKGRSWTAAVRRMLTDDAFRLEQSQAAREVASRFTIEEHAWRWWETWSVAHQINQLRAFQPRPKQAFRLPA